jgi:hypothetical protein
LEQLVPLDFDQVDLEEEVVVEPDLDQAEEVGAV